MLRFSRGDSSPSPSSEPNETRSRDVTNSPSSSLCARSAAIDNAPSPPPALASASLPRVPSCIASFSLSVAFSLSNRDSFSSVSEDAFADA